MVALVRGVHGLHGAVRVEVLTDHPETRFVPGTVLHREGRDEPLTIASAEAVADGPGWRVRFREVASRDAADTLRGAYLEAVVVPEVELGRGEYYWHEVVGVAVRGTDGAELGHRPRHLSRRRERRAGRGRRHGRAVRPAGGPRRSSASSRRAAARSWSMPSRSTSDRRSRRRPIRTGRRRLDGATPAPDDDRDADAGRGRLRGHDAGRRGRRGRAAAAMTLEIDVLTLFPAMFDGPLGDSIPGRDPGARPRRDPGPRPARRGASASTAPSTTPRTAAAPGMVLRPEPVAAALDELRRPDSRRDPDGPGRRGLPPRRAPPTSPTRTHCIFVCPRYEGVDERIRSLVDLELSIGDYVLSGGELPALVVIDAVLRLLPGAIDDASTAEESFSAGLLEYPQYTRPPTFRGMDVPDDPDLGRPRRGPALARGAGAGAHPRAPARPAGPAERRRRRRLSG